MTNNDILRRLRYAFDFPNQKALELFTADPKNAIKLSEAELLSRLAKEEDDTYIDCSDTELAAFLDGLIVAKRGLREPAANTNTPTAPTSAGFRLSKNDTLKKLRIAMNFREQDMLDTLAAGGTNISKSELGALFRNPKHKHYRACGNQLLRNFIKGLTLKMRG